MILRSLLCTLFLSFLTTSVSFAHAGSACSRGAKQISASALPELGEVRPFDVLSYDLQLDWRRPFIEQTPLFSGIQEIRLRVTQMTERITLDASSLRIDSAWVNGTRYAPAPETVDQRLNFDFDVPLQPGTEVTIRMAYTRSDAIYRGVFYFPKGLTHGFEDGDTVMEDIMYTQSEPYDAEYWMPCMNLPYDKADSRISIRVPEGYTGISNGLLENTITHGDGSKTFVWKSDKPIATYLMVANASKFVQWGDFYLRPTNPSDTVRTLYFAWPDDYDNTAEDGTEYNPRFAFRNTPEIMMEFTRLFGEYPFEQYGQVPVAPYGFGGMEHQGMTTVNRYWLLGYDELGIAHEIGHQWFGDKVTCETWNDLWLNEGFATFSEALWAEATEGEDVYLSLISENVQHYFDHGLFSASIYGVPPEQAFMWPYSPVVYSKSMAVVHQLRRFVNNDTLFFNSIRDYLEAFSYSTATTEDFKVYMTGRLGIDLDRFFDQWIFGPGHPVYRIRWNSLDNRLGVRTEQRQDEQEVFASPVRIFVTYDDGTFDTIIVQNTERTQFFTFTLPKNVLKIDQDEDWSILSTRSIARDLDITLSVEDQPSTEIVFWNTRTSLNISSSELLSGTITVLDILGRPVIAESIASSQIIHVPITQLTPGAYFVMLESTQGRRTYRFEITR